MSSKGFAVDEEETILEDLKKREPIFHHPEKFGKNEQDIINQMDNNFWEIGASGTVYTKKEIIQTLIHRYNDPNFEDIWETKDFKLQKIASSIYLLTYTLIQNMTRVSKRSTIWKKEGCNWKIVFHQGTVINHGEKI